MTDRKITVTAEEAQAAVEIVYDLAHKMIHTPIGQQVILDVSEKKRLWDWHFNFIEGKK